MKMQKVQEGDEKLQHRKERKKTRKLNAQWIDY